MYKLLATLLLFFTTLSSDIHGFVSFSGVAPTPFAPTPFCVGSLFSLLAKHKSGGRFACRRCCRVSVGFVKPKRLILFAHFSTASLTVRTEP